IIFFQAEDGIRDFHVTGVQTCALPIFDDDPFVKLPARRSTLVPVSGPPTRMAYVEIMSGPARGTQVAVHGVIALGRDESCDIYQIGKRRVGKDSGLL